MAKEKFIVLDTEGMSGKIPYNIDIIPIILRTKLLTKRYVDFCIENNFLTERGYIQTKAETVHRYLTNNPTFEEEHTGLSDVLIESQILLSAFSTHKKN